MDDKIQIVNIENNQIPIIKIKTNNKTGQLFGSQGIICMIQPFYDNQTLRPLIQKNKPEILNIYNNMTKPVNTERTENEYLEMCQEYIEYYQDKLQVYPDKIRHKYIKPDHLGWAYANNTITYNKYMRYMTKERIKLTIYHELCHLYTLKYNQTFGHNEDFYNILYREFTPEEEIEIQKN